MDKTNLFTASDARLQHIETKSPVILDRAFIQLLKVHPVLERAFLHQGTLWNLVIVLCQTHGEAEVDLGIGIQMRGAQLNNVPHALLGTMHTGDAVIRGRLPKIRECKVDLVHDVLHGG